MFSEAKIAALRARAHAGRLIKTDEVRKMFGIHEQRFRRLLRPSNPFAPKRYRVGRVWCVNGNQMADCLVYQNELEAALGLAQLARFLRIAYYTALQQWENNELPQPFGMLRGRPRWRRCDVATWRDKKLDGSSGPSGFDPGPNRKREARAGV